MKTSVVKIFAYLYLHFRQVHDTYGAERCPRWKICCPNRSGIIERKKYVVGRIVSRWHNGWDRSSSPARDCAARYPRLHVIVLHNKIISTNYQRYGRAMRRLSPYRTCLKNSPVVFANYFVWLVMQDRCTAMSRPVLWSSASLKHSHWFEIIALIPSPWKWKISRRDDSLTIKMRKRKQTP